MSNDLISKARANISDIMAATMGISRGKWNVIGQYDTYAINVKRDDGLVERVVGGDEDTAESLRNRGYRTDVSAATPKPGVVRYNDALFIACAPGLLDRSRSTIEDLMVEVSRLTKANEELAANSAQYAAEADDAEDRVADLERQIEDLRDENADLQDEIDALEDDADDEDSYGDDWDDDDGDPQDQNDTYTHTFTSTETVIETVYYIVVERPEDMFLKVQNALLRIENERLRQVESASNLVIQTGAVLIDELETALAKAETQNENNAYKVQYYDDLEQYFPEANAYCQKYLMPAAWGRNTFLAIFDEAKRIKNGAQGAPW